MTDENVSVNEQDEQVDEEEQAQAETEELSDEEALRAKLKESMEVAIEDMGALWKKLTIRVPRATIDEQLQEQFDELRQEAVVPGFRKGRAPLKLVEKRFGSEVGEQISASLISNSYLAATEKEDLKVLGEPRLHVTVTEERTQEDGKTRKVEVEKTLPVEEALDHLRLPKEGDLVYSCEVDLRPEFELPKLEEIPVERPAVEVSEKDIDEEVHRVMTLRGTYRPVEDGVIETDDLVVGNIRLTVEDQTLLTEENAALHAREQRYKGVLLEGFGEASKGKKVGDDVSIGVTLPEDFDQVDARGKSGKFHFSILDIKRFEVPKADDALVSTLGFENMEEFRRFFRERIEARKDAEIREQMHDQVADYLRENTQLELPAGISQRQAERMVTIRMLELYSQGMSKADIDKQIDSLRTAAADEARKDLKSYFIMEKIAEQLEINVTEEEINAAIAGIAERRGQRFDRVRDELYKEGALQNLYLRIRDTKLYEQLLETASVTEKGAS